MNVLQDSLSLTRLMAEARAVHAVEFRSNVTPEQRFERIRSGLQRVWSEDFDGERNAVLELESRWHEITSAAFAQAKDFPALLARLHLQDEPAAMATTLLRPMGRDLDECSHTRILGALLDSSQSGRMACRLLSAMLKVVAPTEDRGFDDEALNAATIEVEPEWMMGTRPIYPDLVIRVQTPALSRLMVIENKIRATDHEGQLDSYAECAGREDADAVLIYLTPKGSDPVSAEEPNRWIRLSYWKLATAWRRELALHNEAGAWTDVLRLYLASVLQDVLGERLPHVPSRAAQLRLVDYVRAALGEP